MRTALRIVFPNVEDGTARPVVLSVRLPNPMDPTCQARLTLAEIETLHLDEISLACALLDIPGTRLFRSWNIDWGSGVRPVLNGRSAQLAGLLAYLISLRGKAAQPRGWLRDSPEIWATGSIVMAGEPAEPTVEMWSNDTSPPDPSVLHKFHAFARSRAPVMFVPASEARHLAAPAEQSSIHMVALGDFKRILRSKRREGELYLVLLATSELRGLADVVIDGAFPRGAGFWMATAFTISRIPCGLATAWLALRGLFNDAATIYVAGLITDVVDGVLARLMHGTSEFGKQFDRGVDMAFNFTVGAGLCIASYRRSGSLVGTLAIVGLSVGVMGVTRLLGAVPHTGLAKLRSGWIRVVLLGYFALNMNWALGIAALTVVALAALMLAGIALYEIAEVRRDVAIGKRVWWRASNGKAQQVSK